MVWHYNAFLSYEAEPVEEERVWLDADTANQTQVDLTAYLMAKRTSKMDPLAGRLRSAEFRYNAAHSYMEEDEEQKPATLDQLV